VAGNGSAGYVGDGMHAVLTRLNNPTGVAVDVFGNMYIADSNNNRIRLVKPNNIISTGVSLVVIVLIFTLDGFTQFTSIIIFAELLYFVPLNAL
jgi:predicted RND superfamily exporter protein